MATDIITTTVERIEDMSRCGKLRLTRQDDGDIIIAIVPDPACLRDQRFSLEFCVPDTGIDGVNSPQTHAALLDLMDAMQADNVTARR